MDRLRAGSVDLDVGRSASDNHPHRARCEYLAQITYRARRPSYAITIVGHRTLRLAFHGFGTSSTLPVGANLGIVRIQFGALRILRAIFIRAASQDATVLTALPIGKGERVELRFCIP